MSLRVLGCFAVVLFFSGYAYKRWFISLCVAILMMAVLEHPDMPKSIGGIQGLNPWNILMANVIIAWWRDKSYNGRHLDYPPGYWPRFLLFIGLILVSAVRLLIDPGVVAQENSFSGMISDYVINNIKFTLPGILVFDGCRNRKNSHLAIAAILGVYFLLAVQTIRWMPLGMISSGGDLSARASKITQNEIGYNRVTLSMMLAGASWAMLCTLVLVRGWKARVGVLAAAAIIMLGQALTGGRTGYVTWAFLGMALCVIRWRKLLLVIPAVAMLVLTFIPAVRERLLQGIGGQEGNIRVQTDTYSMTSGRNIAWPYVIDGIKEAPILGYGRLAMATTGIRDRLWSEYEESFPHPHNAYLEILLDSGVVGLLIVGSFFLTAVRYSLSLLRDYDDTLSTAAGGICFSLVVALLLGSMGGQTFYPREGAVGLWAAIGLMLRLAVQRTQALENGTPLFPEESISETELDESAAQTRTIG